MNRRSLCAFTLLACIAAAPAQAGIYSGPTGYTPGAIDNPIQRTAGAFLNFESSVVNYSPAPGVSSAYQNPLTGFGSLGDLRNPVGVAQSVLDNKTDNVGYIGYDSPGSITLGFAQGIGNGAGADFAVFENGFTFGVNPQGIPNLFAELAYVEVSTNGVDFARFASISTNTKSLGAFGGYDMTNVYNLAGKSAAGWGTPFDLAQLATDPLVSAGLLNLDNIYYVRLVDVVGSGEIKDASGNPIAGIARDSQGHAIVDNWLTTGSGGFDYLGLNTGAIGVLYHATPEPSSLALAGMGLAAAGLYLKRGKRD